MRVVRRADRNDAVVDRNRGTEQIARCPIGGEELHNQRSAVGVVDIRRSGVDSLGRIAACADHHQTLIDPEITPELVSDTAVGGDHLEILIHELCLRGVRHQAGHTDQNCTE